LGSGTKCTKSLLAGENIPFTCQPMCYSTCTNAIAFPNPPTARRPQSLFFRMLAVHVVCHHRNCLHVRCASPGCITTLVSLRSHSAWIHTATVTGLHSVDHACTAAHCSPSKCHLCGWLVVVVFSFCLRLDAVVFSGWVFAAGPRGLIVAVAFVRSGSGDMGRVRQHRVD
jgi:hypothetical protein